MENTLLYFFSTSSQVLAALFALVAMFYAMRVDKIKGRIQAKNELIKKLFSDSYIDLIGGHVAQSVNEISDYLKIINEGVLLEDAHKFQLGYDSLYDSFKKFPVADLTVARKRDRLKSDLTYIWHNFNLMGSLSSVFKRLLVFNGLVLFGLVSSFLYIHFINCSASIVFLSTGVFFSLLSIYSILLYLYNLVTEQKQKRLFEIPLEVRQYRLIKWLYKNK